MATERASVVGAATDAMSMLARKWRVRRLPMLAISALLALTYSNEIGRYYNIDPRLHVLFAERDSRNSALPSKKRPSPACRPSYPDRANNATVVLKRIVFSHMRKAGGSSLRKYFNLVARLRNLTYKAVEDTSVDPPDERDGSTIYVTNLREPIDRSISHFKYEGRWNCDDLIGWYRTNYTERHPGAHVNPQKLQRRFRERNSSFYPSEGNANNIDGWFAYSGRDGKRVCERKRTLGPGRKKKFLWKCASDCYVRWFADTDDADACTPDPAVALRTAFDRLYRYDLIVVTERLSDREYVRGLEGMFGVRWLTDGNMWCGDASRAANGEIPLNVSSDAMHRLKRDNAEDSVLYEDLTACPNGTSFPKFDPSRFSSR